MANTFDGEWAGYVISPTDYPNLPRDPHALIDAVSAQLHDPSDTQSVAWRLLYSVSFNVAPADLRAAMWEAVKLLPGSELVSADGDIAVVMWNSASEIGKRMQLTFDMSTGDVLQTDWWWPHESELGAPRDMSDYQTKISSEIVDWAPPTR